MADDETTTITVYRESFLWDTAQKAWQLRDAELRALHVATYECEFYDRHRVADEVRALHPGCVLVYCD